ncbi:hypothetical protein [Acinetobacter baumannii]|uniref:hypothetical protein n=1 Tax=Acinetobacter baumannii TaxID=470 RepID=UPI0007EE2EE5|nr:hypothetical protein [Acinetobacter baumannii]MDC4523527.1 hypothetical protein [Acinetobacter baumannii]MDC5023391.1 hypothetical protein [Acinetobacter baumannii]MDC5181029.1 hypothetical protein [Acinetobacter baumannii]MDN8575619.1 hypothetical protein [Acinetobacter baumannii]OBS04234.1 hypothetical protein BAX55_18840 [Acinetobacter baumannii]
MNDEEYKKICKKIKKVHDKITPTGRLSTARSDAICGFLICAISDGLEEEKKYVGERSYKRYINDLKKCGITEKFINKEHEREKAIRKFQEEYPEIIHALLNIDFKNQVPEGYEPPKSQYNIEEIIDKKVK